MTPAYRLFRISDGKPQTLFHAWKGSRVLLLDEVMVAPKKRVWNPGGRTNSGFMSGWHIARTYEDAEKLRTTRFKNPNELVVCRVYVEKLREKPRTNVGAWLAQKMLIRSKDWHSSLIKEMSKKPKDSESTEPKRKKRTTKKRKKNK